MDCQAWGRAAQAAGHGEAVKIYDERLELLQSAQRKSLFALETEKLIVLQRRGKVLREIEAIAGTAIEEDLACCGQQGTGSNDGEEAVDAAGEGAA
jgi:hypothetical protein